MLSAKDSLQAVYINCSLKKNKNHSHTLKLLERSAGILKQEKIEVEILHALDYEIPAGMAKDMTTQGFAKDDWPELQAKVMAADILVIGSPIWLGSKSSVASRVIERLYGYSGETNNKGQYLYYGKTAGVVVTGNEDGAKAVAMETLYSLLHIGFTIPPQADCGWLGGIGPGPSYGDPTESADEKKEPKPAGYDNTFTNRNTTIMTWNLIHMARLLKQHNGLPAQGNVAASWRIFSNAADQDINPVE